MPERAPAQEVIPRCSTPAGKETDWTGFYGFGGGYDLNATRHLAIRMQTDIVYFHVFNDLLKDGRWDFRWSIGPTFHFGGNIRASRNVPPGNTSPVPSRGTSSQSTP